MYHSLQNPLFVKSLIYHGTILINSLKDKISGGFSKIMCPTKGQLSRPLKKTRNETLPEKKIDLNKTVLLNGRFRIQFHHSNSRVTECVICTPYLKLITTQLRFRNSLGATPVLFLNIRLKCWGYLKPSS